MINDEDRQEPDGVWNNDMIRTEIRGEFQANKVSISLILNGRLLVDVMTINVALQNLQSTKFKG